MIEQLTYSINGLAMQCHSELGPGLDEVFYHVLFGEKLRTAGIEHLFKPRMPLMHRGRVADIFEADVVVPNQVVALERPMDLVTGTPPTGACLLRTWLQKISITLCTRWPPFTISTVLLGKQT